MMGQSRTRLLGVIVMAAMFAAGGLTGAVLQKSATAANPPVRQMKRGPSLFETLKLTDAQQAEVCAILERRADQTRPHELAFKAAWSEHGPAIKAIIDATNAEMDSLLTPEQRAQKDRFREERQKYFRERSKQQAGKAGEAKPGEGRGGPGKAEGGPRGDRGGHPGNALGVKCPGLNDDRMGRPWGGDSSPQEKAPPITR